MSKEEVTPNAPGIGPVRETIKCAAIKRSDGIIIVGRNHALCIECSPEGNGDQGFITSTARFVDRQEAGRIAYAAGQIPKPIDILFSEDITGDNPWAGEIIDKLKAELEAADKQIGWLKGDKVRLNKSIRLRDNAFDALIVMDEKATKQLQAKLDTANHDYAELMKERADYVNENKRLAEFARYVIRQECWSIFEQDGGDIQELAEKLGLIVPCVATEEDINDDCDCEVGDAIFKFSQALKGD